MAEAADGLTPEVVDEIVVIVPEAGVGLVLEPVASKRAPRSSYEAKFSLQYSAAAMIVNGGVGVSTYGSNAIADPRVLDLAARIAWGKVEVTIWTHKIDGLTESDFILAAKIDEL